MTPGEFHLEVVEGSPFDMEVGLNTGTLTSYLPVTDDISGYDARITFKSRKTGVDDVSFAFASGYLTIDNINKRLLFHIPIAGTDLISPDHNYYDYDIIPVDEPYLYLRGSVKYIARL